MADKSNTISEEVDSVLPVKHEDVTSCGAADEENSNNWEVLDDDNDDDNDFDNDNGEVTKEQLNHSGQVLRVIGSMEEGAVGGQEAPMDEMETASAAVNISGMDRLLQRHKNEIMFELRKLKFGDRPVTGREDRRQAVAALVNRCVAQPSPRQIRSRLDSRVRAPNSPSAETQRPEEVMIEVNALVERRPVSSILNSLTFRRSLETSLRGAFSSIQRDLRARMTPSPDIHSRRPGSSNSQRTSAEATATAAAVSTPPVAAASAVDYTSMGNGDDSTHRFVAAHRSAYNLYNAGNERSSDIGASFENLAVDNFAESEREGTEEPDVHRPVGHNNRPAHPQVSNSPRDPVLGDQPPVAGAQRAREWLRDNVPPVVNSGVGTNQSEMQQFQLIHEVQRENLIVDLSELIQRHLVTRALEGEFRHVLERRMRNRLEQSGIDGSRVLEQLEQLPRGRPYGRNDFMDMGITAGQGAQGGAGSDPLDDVSVISATAAVALPQAYTQSTTAMTRDIQGLKNQMKEMKRMMQLSFDLQLDIQRAIRQEVAAAVSATLGQAAGAEGGVDTSGGRRVAEELRRRSQRSNHGSESQCLICLDKPVDTVMYQCGHMCLCYGCGMQLRQQGAHCPVCRAPIRDIIKTYKN